MMVGNYCDAELQLSLGPCCSPSNSNSDSDSSKSSRIEGASPHGKQHQIQRQQENCRHQHHQQQQKQPITIFYNGQIFVCDVTDVQARSIISMANKEMEKPKMQQNQEIERPPPKEATPSSWASPPQTPLSSVPARVLTPPQIINPEMPVSARVPTPPQMINPAMAVPARVPTLSQISNPGLLMKGSLQRFLQKREARINTSAPYNNV